MTMNLRRSARLAGKQPASSTDITQEHEVVKKYLPPEIRHCIYEQILTDESRYGLVGRPHRQRKHRHLGIVDTDDILNNPWPWPSIKGWYFIVSSAFESRGEWYQRHNIACFERALRYIKAGTHPDTVNDFQSYYWETRVLELRNVAGKARTMREGPKLWHHILKSNPHWNQRINHISLEFSSTALYYLYPDYFYWNQTPNRTCPDYYFSELCKHITANLANLKTLHLWLKLTPPDIKWLLQRKPRSQTDLLVKLIRNIPVKPGGQFVVRLLVSPMVLETMNKISSHLAQEDPNFEPFMQKWEGTDGPIRYGLMCREYENKFEELMRPDSLGPIEEVLEEMGEAERAYEEIGVSDRIAGEAEALKRHFKGN